MAIKVQVGANGSRIIDDEAGKIYTPEEWENELKRRREAKNDVETEEDKQENGDKQSDDDSSIKEDNDEE